MGPHFDGMTKSVPDMMYENHLKGEYTVEKGDHSLIITASSCYMAKEETLFLIDSLPREGSREYYEKILSSLGLEKPSAIFDKLVNISALRIKKKTPLFRKMTRALLNPDIRLLPAGMQEKIVNTIGLSFLRSSLMGNSALFFLLSVSGIAVSLGISCTGVYSRLAGISTGHPGSLQVLALVLSGSLVHELGHSLTTAACGLGLRPIGFSMYLFFPVFYTNVSGIEKLPSREKAAIDCGGFCLQSIYLFMLLIAWFCTKNMLFLEPIRWISVIMVFNINPFLRTDGYWLYKDVRQGLKDTMYTDFIHYAYMIAFTVFTFKLLTLGYSRTDSLYRLVLSVYHAPVMLLRDGYKILLGAYLIIMLFVGCVSRFRETRTEWVELRGRNRAYQS